MYIYCTVIMFAPPLLLYGSSFPSPLNIFLLSTNSPVNTKENDNPSGSGGVLCAPCLLINK